MEEALEQAKRHAELEYPKEACGYILRRYYDGAIVYFPCTNKATSPSEHFVIGVEDRCSAEDTGDLMAVVHSHPDAPARPSMADRVSCESSGLPWYVLSVGRDESGSVACVDTVRIAPSGYKAPLIGREFCHGVLDCFSLLQDYYKEVLDIEIPHFEREDQWWLKGKNLYLEHYEKAGFVKVDRHDLQLHDIILMTVLSEVPNHGAVFVGDVPGHGRHMILHHLYNRPSRRDVYGGFWYDATYCVLRHKSRVR